MKNLKTSNRLKKIILIAKIKNLREIVNYLLENLESENIKLEFIYIERK